MPVRRCLAGLQILYFLIWTREALISRAGVLVGLWMPAEVTLRCGLQLTLNCDVEFDAKRHESDEVPRPCHLPRSTYGPHETVGLPNEGVS